jgi:hypothetical protein
MHPNTFIDKLWHGAETDTVFVAMSFAAAFSERFSQVFKPAIEAVRYEGNRLAPVRVDESKTGDSIVTDIVRGIAEARAVLVDVSDLSPAAAEPVRNGNVMYELGLAHAVKSPGKVIVVRDDSRKLLFDVSSIPHYTIGFEDKAKARESVMNLLEDRLKEARLLEDMKLATFVSSITSAEAIVLLRVFQPKDGAPVDFATSVGDRRIVPLQTADAIRRLCDLGMLRSHVSLEENAMIARHSITERGRRACLVLGKGLSTKKGEA